MHVVCVNILGAIVLKPRFKIDVVIMIILWKTAKRRATCEDLLYICTRVRQAID